MQSRPSRAFQWAAAYFYETGSGIFYTDAELHAVRGEKEKSLEALKSMLTLQDDGLIPIGSLPVAIEDSPLLGIPARYRRFRGVSPGSRAAMPS